MSVLSEQRLRFQRVTSEKTIHSRKVVPMREGACEGPAERNHTGFFTSGINTHFLVIVGEKKKEALL